MRSFSVLLLSGFLVSPVFSTTTDQVAQKVSPACLTLEDALKAAYLNNQELKEARQSTLSVHERSVQAASGFRPKISLEGSMTGSQSINSGNGKDNGLSASGSLNNQRSGQIILSHNLYEGGGTLASLDKTENQIKSQWAQISALEQNLFLKVIQAFLELAAKKSEIEQLEANKQAMKRNYESAQEKHRIGEETITQVANAEAKLAESDARLQMSMAQHETLKAKFLQLTGIQATATLAPVSWPMNVPADLETALSTAKDKNPEVIAAQYDHQAKQAEAEEVGARLLPKIDLQASSGRDESLRKTSNPYYSGTNDSRDFSTNHQVVVKLSVPLYEGGAIRSQKREAHEASVAKRMAVEKVRLQIVEQITGAWQNMISAKNNMENYDKQVKATEIGLEGTQQEMNVGTKVLLDVLNAQAALLDAKLHKIEAVKNHQLAAFQVMALIGQLNARSLKLPVDYFNPEAHYQATRFKF
jgi:outer membrane protein